MKNLRKNVSWLVLTLLVSVLLWRYQQLKNVDNEAPSSSGTSETPIVHQPMQSRPKMKFHSNPQKLPGSENKPENPYAKKPEGSLIEFQIVDGLAVAYGDVVLGRPDPDFQGKRGHYEISSPQLWDRGEIPYAISPELLNSARVEKAIEYFRQHTPIRFVPYQGQRDALVFEPGKEHCYSSLGRTGGVQAIKLSPGCDSQAIMHEIMHALGFIHEQSRPDRDQFVEIMWENIDEKYQSQFAIVPDVLMETARSLAFDYRSIMLYAPSDFALPNTFTMRSKSSEQIAPTQNGLSETDIKKLNHVYGLFE